MFGRQATYLSQAPGDWDNPSNWETVSSSGKVVDDSKSPPSDRLPCNTDTVVFPVVSLVGQESKVFRADGRLVNMSGVFCTNVGKEGGSLASRERIQEQKSVEQTKPRLSEIFFLV